MLHINMIQNVYNTDLSLMRRKTILEAMEWPEASCFVLFCFFSLCAAAKLSRILNESSSCSKLSVNTK